jgi:hypothetical protein
MRTEAILEATTPNMVIVKNAIRKFSGFMVTG